MPRISERDLSVFISLLAVKIREMAQELRAAESSPRELSDDEIEDRYALQETLQQYDQILDSLREDYEAALKDGINLPPFDVLTRVPGSTSRNAG